MEVYGTEDKALRCVCSKQCTFGPRIEDASYAAECQVGCSPEGQEGSREQSCFGVDDNL